MSAEGFDEADLTRAELLERWGSGAPADVNVAAGLVVIVGESAAPSSFLRSTVGQWSPGPVQRNFRVAPRLLAVAVGEPI